MRLGLCLSLALVAATPAMAQRVYIGTNTEPATGPNNSPSARGHGQGIYMAEFDPASGKLSTPKLAAKADAPTWLLFNKDHSVLYAANTYGGFPDPQQGNKNFGAVSAYKVDKTSGALTLIDKLAVGDDPCHLSIDPSGKFLISANYDDGSIAVFPIQADGGLNAYTDLVRPKGKTDPETAADNPVTNYAPSNHAHSHVHSVGFDPSGKNLIVDDAGLDNVLRYSLSATGKLTLVSAVHETPGSAPRHFVFAADGKHFYNLLEQDSKLAVSSYDPAKGFTPLQKLSTLPAGFKGSSLASELLLSPDQKHLYAANRLHDSIASFAVGGDGKVSFLGTVHTEDDYPRSLTLDPKGQYLFSMNQYGDSVTVFRIGANGIPVFTGQWVPLGNPMTMVFD